MAFVVQNSLCLLADGASCKRVDIAYPAFFKRVDIAYPAFFKLNPRSNKPIWDTSAESPSSHPIVTSQQPAGASDLDPSALPKDAFLDTYHTAYRTVFLIDDFISIVDKPWKNVAVALKSIISTCTVDNADGIDLYFVHKSDEQEFCQVTPERVDHIFEAVQAEMKVFKKKCKRLFRPWHGISIQAAHSIHTATHCTYTARRLDDILKLYLKALGKESDNDKDVKEQSVDRLKPLNIIVISNNKAIDDLRKSIDNAAAELDSLTAPQCQVGIQFIQFGQDKSAAHVLRSLKEELHQESSTPRADNMVDVLLWSGTNGSELSGEVIMEAVLRSVRRRSLNTYQQ